MPRDCWNDLLNWLAPHVVIRRPRTTRVNSVRRKFASVIEDFEPRIVPAALCDLAPALVQGPVAAAPGDRITVNIEINNLGAVASPKFQVEIRLSLDGIIDSQDQLLVTVGRRKISVGDNAQWSQRLKLPENLPAGTYHIGVVVDPGNQVPEQNEINNSLADTGTIAVFRDALTGRVKYQKGTQPVEIHALGDGLAPINPDITTWIVIHGRNESSTSPDLVALAQQIDQYQPGDQVLVLDWKKAAASGELGGQGENYIRPVAAWAAQALTDYGFTGPHLNLVGYSWGAEVAAEMSEDLGDVNSILAIDPARDYPGGSYNPDAHGEVDFQAHADHSWAFFATSSFPFGSPIPASTAENAIVLTGSDHFGIVSVVTSVLALPDNNPIAADFSVAALLTALPLPTWQPDSYSPIGSLDLVNGVFDAELVATVNGKSVSALRYFDGSEERTISA
ncbi:MAG: Hemolysin-type calcium-binding repeat family protein [Planctomycetaceae bacterium]|nr:Hemolysin-type calcium-binding repeat family protein [Planctomycetaceae bacterium]